MRTPFSDFVNIVTGISADSVAVPSFAADQRLQEEYEPARNLALQTAGAEAVTAHPREPIDLEHFKANRQKGAEPEFVSKNSGLMAERTESTERQYTRKGRWNSQGSF